MSAMERVTTTRMMSRSGDKGEKMVFRQNYGAQRAERDRLKQAKKEAKIQEKREAATRRKAGEDSDAPIEAEMAAPDDADATGHAEDTTRQ